MPLSQAKMWNFGRFRGTMRIGTDGDAAVSPFLSSGDLKPLQAVWNKHTMEYQTSPLEVPR